MFVSVSPMQAEILSVLSHRNIIQFYGAILEAPNYGIVIGKFVYNPNLESFSSNSNQSHLLSSLRLPFILYVLC